MNFILYLIIGLLLLFWITQRLLPYFLKRKLKKYQDKMNTHTETKKSKNIKIKMPKGYKKAK